LLPSFIWNISSFAKASDEQKEEDDSAAYIEKVHHGGEVEGVGRRRRPCPARRPSWLRLRLRLLLRRRRRLLCRDSSSSLLLCTNTTTSRLELLDYFISWPQIEHAKNR